MVSYPNIQSSGQSFAQTDSFLLIGITAVLGLFLIIIVYYIVVSHRGDNQGGDSNQGGWNSLYNNMNMPINQQSPQWSNPTLAMASSVPIAANSALSTMTAAPTNYATTTTQPQVPEVFNVKANIYTLEDAPAACGALNGDVATIEQLIDAHKNGADWCNVGWTKDGLAGYPTQLSTWQILQNSPGQETSCGKPGINLVRNDPNLLYGVNCYGPKPVPVGSEKIRTGIISSAQEALNAKIAELQRGGHMGLAAFNADKWSAT